jgi:hypothetical protein
MVQKKMKWKLTNIKIRWWRKSDKLFLVVSGSIFEEVGVDVLGLKEIGIDAFSV